MAAFTVIDHTELGASASSWDVTSIPTDGTYDHLMLKVSSRTDEVGQILDDWGLRFNADTGSNYSRTHLVGWTATPASGQATGQTSINYMWGNTGPSATANTFGVLTVWIPHYANTANFKQALCSWAGENASTTDYRWAVGLTAGLWSDTSAIDQITLFDISAADFVQYSTFTLYGVTGA